MVISSGRRSTRASGKRVAADISTSLTANGSVKKLTEHDPISCQQDSQAMGKERQAHSAEGVAFPGTSIAPPMITTRPIRSRTHAPSVRSICARLVSGPRLIYVTERAGCPRRRSRAAS